MRSGVRIVLLVVSRLLIALLVGGLYWVSRMEMQSRAAERNPLHRVGLILLAKNPLWPDKLDENLEQLSRSGHAAAAEVIGLVALLQQERLQEASECCQALGWTRCGSEDIQRMRDEVPLP